MSGKSREVRDDAESTEPVERYAIVAIKCMIVPIGLFFVFQGMALDASTDEHAPYANLEGLLIFLVYFSVLLGDVLSFFSTVAASVAMGTAALCAFAIVALAGSAHGGLGLGLTTNDLILAIVLRPVTLCLVLLAFWRLERMHPHEKK
jgi:hypothetical protein